jgi:two-component system phosphate regulon sensor histidine kinase PhoR
VTLGIRGKLFLASFAAIVLSVAVADLYLGGALDRFLTEQEETQLAVRAQLVARDAGRATIAAGDRAGWDALADGLGAAAQARVTLVARDGTVLGDSEVPAAELPRLESHAGREEVRKAFANGRGAAIRYSTTQGRRMMYVAAVFPPPPAAAAGVARVAVPLKTVDEALDRMRWFLVVASLLALLAAMVFSTVAAVWSGRSVRHVTAAARRMAAGDLAARTRATGKDEAAELGRTIDSLAENLSRTITDLQGERDLLQGVLQGMTEGVLLLDGEGRVALVNPALRESLLLDAEVAGKLLLEAVRHAGLRDLLDAARAGSQPVSGEIEIAGLRPRRLLVHARTLPDRPPGGLLAVFVDVTDLRRLETIRKDFVANVSHELRTPVAAVRSAAETLRGAMERDPAAASRFCEIIERNAERLQRLVEDLLDLSRIESREYRPQLEPLDLSAIAQHLQALYRARVEAKPMGLSFALPTDLPRLKADRRALEQVLCNLLDNAVKYCPAGSSVTVRAEVENGKVRVRVADDGPGIAPEHLGRLFERFYRVDAGRSRDLGGTGLGLSIVKHLVEAMGGAVGVESTPGRGTTFWFSLPHA